MTGSFVDYTLPTAADLISFTNDNTVSPSTTNDLGAKGVGEAGCIASTPAVVNAIVDALRPMGVNDIRMPCPPSGCGRPFRPPADRQGLASRVAPNRTSTRAPRTRTCRRLSEGTDQ